MYHRIRQLSESDADLKDPELAALGRVWLERKDQLRETGEFKEFLKKLQREWAIETGIIERLYNWDRGVTEVLIEHGIDASLIAHRGGLSRDEAKHVNDIIRDQLDIIEGLFSYVKGEQPLTEHFIRGLQSQFTANQHHIDTINGEGIPVRLNVLRGKYKQMPNNPRRPDDQIHEYCPPEIVQEEMERLVKLYRDHEDSSAPEVLAAWLHHRFTQIHPFQDGNGRVARALASLVFLKKGFFPLVVRDAEREEYIGALERADAGDLKTLVRLFARRQRSSILAAIGLEQQVKQQRYAEEVISSAISVLKDRYSNKEQAVGEVYEAAGRLLDRTDKRLNKISDRLDSELRPLTPVDQAPYHANTRAGGDDSRKRHYYYAQIIKAAKQLDYFANLDVYRAWVRLVVFAEGVFEFVVSFHGYGPGRHGILAASAFTFQRVPTEEQGSEFVNVKPSVPEIFQFNYAEPYESIEKRFDDWLESACAVALSEWKRQIDT